MPMTTYKEKLICEIEEIPENMLPKFYRIVHLLKTEIMQKALLPGKRGSLKGIWGDNRIDEHLFAEAKKSLFPYEDKE